ncbi:exonuclease family protein [Galdieria sulphuraria]|uniref:RNA exonuclease 4 n=1 Tax=Galdieria sulphuraria TaxID=130081 RepID=M2XU66_GALSU|nr:exonuclease family protein [Galdieria sulphuraria]EME27208.1 exonuclease family protein [Galdieria sulphuraria]|eukprot:XP_005703728.1 exonuclease family protein [Galdieria sulphuraria]
MEQVIAQVIKRQQTEERPPDVLSQQTTKYEKRNSASLRKRKNSSKLYLKTDQNWMALREKLASNSIHDKGKYRQKRESNVTCFKSGVESGIQNSSVRSRETQVTFCDGTVPSQGLELANSKSTAEISSRNEIPRLTKVVALDCEFVGVGKLGKEHSLARVSIVNFKGEVLYDKYVLNDKEPVVDYRTSVSGIRPEHLRSSDAVSFEQAQRDVYSIIRNRILVGHAIHHDMHALLLSHPRKLIRDTSKWRGLRSHHLSRKTPSLRKLAQEILGIRIQDGEHDSVEDARATLMIYKRFAKEWEMELQTKKKWKF